MKGKFTTTLLAFATAFIALASPGPISRSDRVPLNWARVQAILQLSPPQVERLQLIQAQFAVQMATFSRRGNLGDGRRGRLSQEMVKFTIAVERFLTPSQLKRLDQQGGIYFLLDGRNNFDAFREVGLTPDQANRLKELRCSASSKIATIRANPHESSAQKELAISHLHWSELRDAEGLLDYRQRHRLHEAQMGHMRENHLTRAEM